MNVLFCVSLFLINFVSEGTIRKMVVDEGTIRKMVEFPY
jgi:hypothetical protein